MQILGDDVDVFLRNCYRRPWSEFVRPPDCSVAQAGRRWSARPQTPSYTRAVQDQRLRLRQATHEPSACGRWRFQRQGLRQIANCSGSGDQPPTKCWHFAPASRELTFQCWPRNLVDLVGDISQRTVRSAGRQSPNRYREVLSFEVSRSPEIVSFDICHCYVFGCVFDDISIARCRRILKSRDSTTNCVWNLRVLRSTMRELTYPTTESTMELAARHLHWYWRRASFQKDNGHTESLTSVRRTISTSNGRSTS